MDPTHHQSPPLQALAALSTSDLAFLHSLPKAELHAHLNGCIPFPLLQALAHDEHLRTAGAAQDDGRSGLSAAVKAGIDKLEGGVQLETFQDFFALFPAIYHLTSTPSTIARATTAVLTCFLSPSDPADPSSAADCQYLELRTTPRADARTGLTREDYLDVVLSTVDAFNVDARAREVTSATTEGRAARPGFGEARLIVSLDYRMDEETITTVLALATSLRAAGRPIVGLDVCGDPSAPPAPFLLDALRQAKAAGWQLTIHVAELEAHDRQASAALLALGPARIGHGTFLDAEARQVVQDQGIVVEVCLTSNVLCKTTATTADSHLHHYLAAGHPATICTDDTLPFATSLLAEYALLLAPTPLGLGMSREEVAVVARNSVDGRFAGW